MKIPSFEDFMNSITLTDRDDNNTYNVNSSNSIAELLVKATQEICFNLLECYHNWLTEQLESKE